MQKYIVIFFLSFFLPRLVLAQEVENKIEFTFSEFIQNILLYHPLAKKADLQSEMGELELTSARKGLVPYFSSELSQKDFKKTDYYNLFKAKLKIPTVYGVSVIAGYENNTGEFLNPENYTTDKNGLWSLGIEADLLQGLLVNERKIALEQAEFYQGLAENQRLMLLNTLFYDASLAYIDWQKAYESQKVYQQSLELSSQYLQQTKDSYKQGEKARIDTVEAFALWQEDKLKLTEGRQKLLIARQKVQNYLWMDGLVVELKEKTKPSVFGEVSTVFSSIDSEEENFESLLDNHPKIKEKQYKKSIETLKQRLKKEKLKPKLSVKYNPLVRTVDNILPEEFNLNNYKWGVKLASPILLGPQKAEIQKAALKIEGIDLEIQAERNKILNELNTLKFQKRLLMEQIELQEQNVESYRQLLEGEKTKFRFGESSVFMLTKRQEKFIDKQLKLVKLQAQLNKVSAKYLKAQQGFLRQINQEN